MAKISLNILMVYCTPLDH